MKTVVKKDKVPKYELISFSVKATIPTQMYGNIMPEIVIKTKTIEEAKAIIMPVIEELHSTYAEKPRDGSHVSFMNKANVTVTEKKVDVTPAVKGAEGFNPDTTEKPKTPAQESADSLATDLTKSPAYTKAESAVKNCSSIDALNMIEDQIQKSVKLSDKEKPELLTEVLKKRKTFS